MSDTLTSSPVAQTDEAPDPKENKSRLAFWLSIIGTVVTIILTLFNAYTKNSIDKAEQRLKEAEVRIKEREQALNESRAELEVAKGRIDRYNWVHGLFADLDDNNLKKKSFTVNLIRLALTDREAEQMFAGFQASPSKELQVAGRSGFFTIQNEPIVRLAAQLNSPSDDVSKKALDALLEEYESSSTSIGIVLSLFDEDSIDNLSPNGAINAFGFLKGTDPSAWNKQHIYTATKAIQRVEAKELIPKSKSNLEEFKSFLKVCNGYNN